ncbi:hypothetical protein [Mycobacterium sp. M23085]|uniref:hypothetical protein n=1 Tax=Mycobacterium sp. M23085 TaxID=3378087 RepID=UPI003877B6B0
MAVVDPVQDGIALLLLGLDLGDVGVKGTLPLVDDFAVARVATETQVCPSEHETAINHLHPPFMLHRKAVTGRTF